MSKEKETTVVQSTTTTNNTQTVKADPTPEEIELNKLAVEREKATNPGLIAAQTAGLDLVRQLLQGQEALPGFFENLNRGISPELTSDIVQESLADISPQFAQSGLLDSGVRAVISGRVAGDIRRASEEFNIGNRLNLLNLALSGQAQVQQPILGFSSMLSDRLSGLRTINSSGNSTQSFSGNTTTKKMNPFLKSFQTSLGSTLGSPSFAMGPVSF